MHRRLAYTLALLHGPEESSTAGSTINILNSRTQTRLGQVSASVSLLKLVVMQEATAAKVCFNDLIRTTSSCISLGLVRSHSPVAPRSSPRRDGATLGPLPRLGLAALAGQIA